MDIFTEMAKHPVFTTEDVDSYYHNINSSRSALKRLLSHNRIMKIRNNLYTCISPESDGPIADRFQIASSITDTSYVSHHTAMEYYGITDQVFYEVYVSSETRFHDFDFDGYTYHFVKSRIASGIDSPPFSGGIRVTDKERTILDCLKDMDTIAGPEEVIDNIKNMMTLDENKLLYYLAIYSNQFLYQKTGFILWPYRKSLGLSDPFFIECKSHIVNSKRYLLQNAHTGIYDSEWKLVVPEDLFELKNGEVITDAAV